MHYDSKIIEVNDISINVVVAGEGPAVLFLHGFPDSLHLWDEVLPLFVAAGHKVVAYDQRGFGLTDAPVEESAYKIDAIIGDVIAVLKALNISEKVIVVGHDWGSVIGWLFAIRHPEFVERLVAISVGHPTSYRNSGLAQKIKGWYIWMFLCRGLGEFLISRDNFRSFRKMGSRHPRPGYRENTDRRVRDLSRPGRLTAGLNWYRANARDLFLSETGNCTVPTLGIYGPDIALTAEQMISSKNYVDAPWRYVEMTDCTHWIPLDKPKELAEVVIEWLGGV
ncbi:MAG: alpha/beta fold hydrolase [Candidatus Obscuribacterales bacterium]